jgi:hypothetical protein
LRRRGALNSLFPYLTIISLNQEGVQLAGSGDKHLKAPIFLNADYFSHIEHVMPHTGTNTLLQSLNPLSISYTPNIRWCAETLSRQVCTLCVLSPLKTPRPAHNQRPLPEDPFKIRTQYSAKKQRLNFPLSNFVGTQAGVFWEPPGTARSN